MHILVYDGAEAQDFVGPHDVFAYAEHAGGAAVQTSLVRPGGPGEVTCSFGTRILVDKEWRPADADILVIPGGTGVDKLRKSPSVLRDLRRAHQSGVVLAGVCTGVLVLSAAGLLKGRPCTTHHLTTDVLKREGGELVPARVVDDKDIVTAGGVTSGLDLALWMVTREFGSSVAAEIEDVMEYEQRGVVWRRD
ncbi:DJ-1/PfpI family protein [Streptomyces anandii]|uniref:DJ-1/PfpI family protein n=1 Tax=Streptomyces anandii TaxID=285454 RepID=UPI001E29AFA0|nr:DJ-1/PfpI family protein [Streptomyces anandii]